MRSLISELLYASQIELGVTSWNPESLNLPKLASDVLRDVSETWMGAKTISIHEEYEKSLPLIFVDPELMKIVLQNLFSNAIKYTSHLGTVTIKITRTDGASLKKKDISIVVADTGYGIPSNQQMYIFTKFFRANNAKQKDTDGTGLGLYIVKGVLAQLGGKIAFQSVENKGTTFIITLPESLFIQRN